MKLPVYRGKEAKAVCVKNEDGDWIRYKPTLWISVKDKLPTPEDGKVLIYTSYGISIAERTIHNKWKGDCAISKLITHWMQLPAPPIKED